MQDKSLKQQLFANITVIAAITFLSKIVTIITGVAIARLLNPDDFGIWGLALSIMAFLELFNEMGLKQAVVQKKTENEEELFATGFLLRTLISVALFLVLYFLVAPLSARFFAQPALVPITVLLAVVMLINNTRFIPETRIIRSNDFSKMLIPSLVDSVSYSVLVVGFALAGFKFWSFIWAKLISALLGSAAYYWAMPWRLTLNFNKTLARELVRFGKFLLLAGVIDVFVVQMDNWTVGKMLGLTALGYYTLAFRWSGFITLDIATTLNRALWPLNVKYQDDPSMLEKIQIRSLTYTSLLIVPITIGFVLVCPEVVRIFFGEKWMPSVLPLQILAFHSLFWSLAKRGNLFEALGDPKYITYQKSLNFALVAVLIIPLTKAMDINGTAWCVTFAKAMVFVFFLAVMIQRYGINLKQVVLTMAYPLLGALVMAAAVYPLKHFLYSAGLGQVTVLSISVLAGAVVYAGCSAVFMNGEIKRIGKAVFQAEGGTLTDRVKAMIVAL